MKYIICTITYLLAFVLLSCATIKERRIKDIKWGKDISAPVERDVKTEYMTKTEITKEFFIINVTKATYYNRFVKREYREYDTTIRTATNFPEGVTEEYDGCHLGSSYLCSFMFILPIFSYPIDVIRQRDTVNSVSEWKTKEVDLGKSRVERNTANYVDITVYMGTQKNILYSGKTDKKGSVRIELNKLIEGCAKYNNFVVWIQTNGKGDDLQVRLFENAIVMNNEVYRNYFKKREEIAIKVDKYKRIQIPSTLNEINTSIAQLAKQAKNEPSPEVKNAVEEKIKEMEVEKKNLIERMEYENKRRINAIRDKGIRMDKHQCSVDESDIDEYNRVKNTLTKAQWRQYAGKMINKKICIKVRVEDVITNTSVVNKYDAKYTVVTRNKIHIYTSNKRVIEINKGQDVVIEGLLKEFSLDYEDCVSCFREWIDVYPAEIYVD